MKSLAVVFVFLIGHTAVSGVPERENAPGPFSMLLERTETGWAAYCDAGCLWRAASFECRTPCAAIVDANGLVTARTPRGEQTSFGFEVEHTSRGARAVSRTGTAWQTLSWDCETARCEVRIDAFGVSAAPLR